MLHVAFVPTDDTDRRKPGRPEGPERLQMTAYVDPALHEEFRVAAARYRTSISAYVEAAMRQFVADGGLLKPPPELPPPQAAPQPEKPRRKR